MSDFDKNNHTSRKVGLARLAKARNNMNSGIGNTGMQSSVSAQEDSSSDADNLNKETEDISMKEPYEDSPISVASNEYSSSFVNDSSSASSFEKYNVSDVYIRKVPIPLIESSDTSPLSRSSFSDVEGTVNMKISPVLERETIVKIECEERNQNDDSTLGDDHIFKASGGGRKKFERTNETERDVTPPKETEKLDERESSPLRRAFDNIHRLSFRKKKVANERNIGRKESLPTSSLDYQLKVPKPMNRSRSLSRLSDALSNVQMVTLLAAQSSVEAEDPSLQFLHTATDCFTVERNPSVNLSSPSHPYPKVSSPMNVYFPSQSSGIAIKSPRSNPCYGNSQSPKLRINLRRGKNNPARVIRDDNREIKPCKRPSLPCDICRSPNAPGMKSKSRSRKSRQGSGHTEQPHENEGVMVANGRKTVNEEVDTNGARIVQDVANLTCMHLTASQLVDSQNSGRVASWFSVEQNTNGSSQEDASSDEYDSRSQESEETVGDLSSSRRWASLGRLSSEGSLCGSSPLGAVKTSDARHKTSYLFGGLGSLLGPTELERYFPDRTVTIFIATWNMNNNEPPTSLDDFLLPDELDHMPDMYVIGTQESGGDRVEWEVRLQTTIGPSHLLFTSAILGILHLTVFLRRDLVWFCTVPEEAVYSLRPGTYFKTKGAVAISFQFFGTKLLFVNTHLFAHEEKLAQRIQNYKYIIQNLDIPKNLRGSKMHRARNKDVTNRFDVVFWLGDLNFRLVGDRNDILGKIKLSSNANNNTDLQELMKYDQLTQARIKGEIFQEFDEGMIHFSPTFKFDVGSNHYDSSSKQRVPSYTDRILYKSSRDPVICTYYNSCPLFKTSDHKPVCGLFHFKVRPGKDDVPLAAGLFNREVYLAALKRRRRFFHQPSSKNCQMQ